ncbi:MAG TPA: hypothetical protein VE931_10720 [Pyrinomonadaceae bacterium]|nr:hypothetical protein [Pyrinomonadaceae bacterium]
MTCRNCERVVAPTRTRCPACRTKLPAWYLIASICGMVAIIVAFKVVEAIL